MTEQAAQSTTEPDAGALPPPIPLAPPTTPGPLMVRRKRTVWPEWFGIVLVVTGAAGFVWGIVSIFFTDFATGISPMATTNSPAMGLSPAWATSMKVYSAVYALSGVYLGVGGALLAARRASCAWHIVVWSITRLIIGVAGMVLMVLQNPDVTTWLRQGPVQVSAGNTLFKPVTNLNNAGMNVTLQLGFTLLWIVTLPAICLVVFTLPAVKREVSAWRERAKSRQS
jgi:hypothetical protein